MPLLGCCNMKVVDTGLAKAANDQSKKDNEWK
jgi:hypothetical protein